MADHPTIMVKFNAAASNSARQREIQSWVGDDLVVAKPLFPDADDEDLSTLFQVDVKENCQAQRVVEMLLKQKEVEYAHQPAERKTK
jgi:hypothetical protein